MAPYRIAATSRVNHDSMLESRRVVPPPFMVKLTPMHSSATDNDTAALLQAFDRLFDRAAAKLNVKYTDEERDEARQSFAERFRDAIRVIEASGAARVSSEAMREMEAAIDDLSPAHVAGYLAVGPLAIHLGKVMRSLAVKAAERRLIEDLISQADDRYGGN
jgi:hypothetical protein